MGTQLARAGAPTRSRGEATRRRPQQLRDLAVTVATVLPGQFDDIGSQPLLVVTTVGRFTLRRAMLTERRTSATLGDVKLTSDMLNTAAATRRAQ